MKRSSKHYRSRVLNTALSSLFILGLTACNESTPVDALIPPSDLAGK